MENDHLHEEIKALKILNQIAFQLNGALALDTVMQQTLELTIQHMQMQTGWIWLLHPGSNSVFLAASYQLPPAFTEHPERLSGWCYCIEQYLSNELADATNISEITCTRLKDLTEGTEGLMYHATVPLFDGDKKMGLLNLVSKKKNQLDEKQLDLLHTIGSLLSTAIQRTRLFEESKTRGSTDERQRLLKILEHSIGTNLNKLAEKIKRSNPTDQFEIEKAVSSIQQELKDINSSSTPHHQALPFQYPVSPLSKRELEVLDLIKKGKTNKDIAAELFITERTVKFHVSTILGKLGAKNRTDAVHLAVKRGIAKL